MSDDKKELPSLEYSLKSISWHMKCLVEVLNKIERRMEDAASGNSAMPPF